LGSSRSIVPTSHTTSFVIFVINSRVNGSELLSDIAFVCVVKLVASAEPKHLLQWVHKRKAVAPVHSFSVMSPAAGDRVKQFG